MSLVEALTLIKKTCMTAKDCDCCPLRNYDCGCYIQDVPPSDWIFEDKTVPPMVFR